MAPEPTPARGAMSLYANLLDPSTDAPGIISRAPVVFKQSSENQAQPDDGGKKQQLKDGMVFIFHVFCLCVNVSDTPFLLSAASLRFQPTRRPQLSQKPKPKHTLPKIASHPQPSASRTSVPTKSTLADWAALEDDDYEYAREKRQRGGRKKRKKNHESRVVHNWDDIYDPSRPNNHEEYRNSEEKIYEVREWKDFLYAHLRKRSLSEDSDSDDDHDRPKPRMFILFTHDEFEAMTKESQLGQFAPPSSFAPPPNLNNVPPPAAVPDDPTGEDAFARRAALVQYSNDESGTNYGQHPPPPPPDDLAGKDAYMQRFQRDDNQPSGSIPPPPPTRPLDAFQPSSATISRAPVRYNLPPPPEDIPASQAELDAVLAKEQPADEEEQDDSAPRSLRPGQQGFAERLLSKYGWTKGSGLGATGSGMVKPLQVKVEKRKKRPDSEGGGFVTPAGRGKIIGSSKKGEYETSKFGPMGEVIILRGMLDGMDLDAEMEGSQNGGLMQEIGEECNEKYGTVERVFIARDAGTPVPVFIKFTSPLSALRAVNALEGRNFNGNTIVARFYDLEKFNQGIYVD
ncbi:hypothetical protein N7457_002249 [Penicillium paradoxum]|uniref:uncharacterized protein n=1 Tax=Penicillium paradoxum TaxID=176176 RepID=UPI0025476E23|nr:uncharacterized protein N7457_002249 [Penicillium paradoxum]KAJ5787259.1 hypothetical protein N7457_002249 [Penicillium paradoxum]